MASYATNRRGNVRTQFLGSDTKSIDAAALQSDIARRFNLTGRSDLGGKRGVRKAQARPTATTATATKKCVSCEQVI